MILPFIYAVAAYMGCVSPSVSQSGPSVLSALQARGVVDVVHGLLGSDLLLDEIGLLLVLELPLYLLKERLLLHPLQSQLLILLLR
jgi:hypothetical protein